MGALQAQMQQKMLEMRVTASSGGGAVTVTCDGYGDIKEIHIDPQVLKEPDTGVLEDMVRAAVNEAHRQAREQAQQELQSIAPLPNLFGLT